MAGVYVAGDAGNAVQSALLAATSGASAAFFMNHSLVADEDAAEVGASARFDGERIYPAEWRRAVVAIADSDG